MAPRADEGRSIAAISPGELRASFDPGVSEWGNPPGVMSRYSRLNQIGRVEGTRRTETSKYPQEKMSSPE